MQEQNFTQVADKLIQKLDCELSINETSIKQAEDTNMSVKFSDVVLTSFLDKISSSGLGNDSFKTSKRQLKDNGLNLTAFETVHILLMNKCD